MIEANNPIDIGKEQIKEYRPGVEKLVEEFPYRGQRFSLSALVSKLDKDEPFIMSDTERDTYLALRTSLQIFKAVAQRVSEKTGLEAKLASGADLKSPEVAKLKEFTYGYATFIASAYAASRLDEIVANAGPDKGTTVGESADTITELKREGSQEATMSWLMAPLFFALTEHRAGTDNAFQSELDFPVLAKQVFDRYATLAKQRKDAHPDLRRHVDGYQWRLMDGFLAVQGWDVTSRPQVAKVQTALSFQPIGPNEIVGNKRAKRDIRRGVDRLMLYDPKVQKNPMLELGGVTWSNLFDGPPGTGKSSLFRMAMTRTHELSQLTGLPYHIIVVDQSVKDEFYGKTGKILLERLQAARDAGAVSLGIFDDIDLLTTKRQEAQGADNDINNIVMQYLDGAFTVRLGNVTNFAASNKPTGLDEATRNRFSKRILIDGPVTAEDFADILVMNLKSLRKASILKIEDGYQAFATQDLLRDDGTWTGEKVAEYMADRFAGRRRSTIREFGEFMAGLKRQMPSITGRSMKAITDTIRERAADFDVPAEWFANPAVFRQQPFERKVAMVNSLYESITPDVLFQVAQEYFDSEERYATNDEQAYVDEGLKHARWERTARLKAAEEELAALRGGESEDVKLQFLELQLRKLRNEKLTERARKLSGEER